MAHARKHHVEYKQTLPDSRCETLLGEMVKEWRKYLLKTWQLNERTNVHKHERGIYVRVAYFHFCELVAKSKFDKMKQKRLLGIGMALLFIYYTYTVFLFRCQQQSLEYSRRHATVSRKVFYIVNFVNENKHNTIQLIEAAKKKRWGNITIGEL